MRTICVFCGSSAGLDEGYARAARALGRAVADARCGLVYGGARVGLMGAVADAALAAGGHVTGVIPRALVDREIAHAGLSELVVVDSMHERKARMADRASAFVALPGGIGTLEELFEVWTWAHLGLHHKPIGLLDVGGFWQPLLVFLDHAVSAGFLRADVRAVAIVDDDAARLLARLEATAPVLPAVVPALARADR